MKFLRAMKKIKIKKQIIAAVMACVLGIGGIYSVHASVINDAKNKKNEAQQELDNLNSQIDEIQAAQSDLQEEMDAYDDQLMALLTDMDLLENDMDAKQDEIDQANADLEVAQEKEQTQYNAMKTRIQYMYENGDSNYWEAMMGATSITDLLNRVEYVSEVYDYDRKQLTAYQETVQQVADLKDQLNAQLAEMEELKISYEDQASSLQALIAEKSAAMDNFDAQLIGFGQFRRADIIAGQQIIGIGRNSSLILAAVRLDQLFQLIARMSFERPRNDDLFAVETIPRLRNAGRSPSAVPKYPGSPDRESNPAR